MTTYEYEFHKVNVYSEDSDYPYRLSCYNDMEFVQLIRFEGNMLAVFRKVVV